MGTKYSEEIDSWLVLNPDNREIQNSFSSNQIDGCLNQYSGQFNQLQTHGIQQVNHDRNYGMIPIQYSTREGFAEVPQEEEEILKFYQGIQHDFSKAASANILDASLPPTTGAGNGIISETTTIGSFSNTMDLPREWVAPNHFSLLPFHYGNLIDEKTVGLSHSNSTSLSSEGTQLISKAAGSSSSSKKPFFKVPTMSRQERVLRYFEKKKARKYEKKIQYSSRKTYAQTRPRVCGRFARRSPTDKTDV